MQLAYASFIAKRADRAWGHAIDVSVFNYQNIILGRLTFFCHPEFKDFELYQSYETVELVKIASDIISKDLELGSYTAAWNAGVTPLLRFNIPNEELSADEKKINQNL